MPYCRSDDGHTVACPQCGEGGRVYRREDLTRSQGDAPFTCHECGSEFSEPVEREAREWRGQANGDAVWQHRRREVLREHGLLDDPND